MGGGGAERQLSYLAPAQAASGDDVHVVMVDDGVNSTRLRTGCATIHLLPSRGAHDPLALVRLYRLASRLQPDVIQTWLTRFDILGGLVALQRGVPWILSERASALLYPPTAKNRARVALARRATAVIANSAEGIAYWNPLLPERVRRFVIPNALALADIDTARAVDPRTGWVSAETPLILFAGRFSAQKNALVMVDAVIRTLREHAGVALLAGDGPERAGVESAVTASGLGDRIRVRGYLEDLWSVLKTATVMLSPSLFEGHPNVVSEAMACRCPLVLSDIAIHRRLAHGAALFADAASAGDLASALVEVLSDPARARQRSEAGRAYAEELSVSAAVASYRHAYDAVGVPTTSGGSRS